MGNKKYEGVHAASARSIEINFYYQNKRCRERIKLKPTPTNLRKAHLHRAAIINAIANDTFDYSITFPTSNNAHKFLFSLHTIKSYLKEWLKNKKPTIKASTYNDYKKTVNNHLVPAFGDLMLGDLKRMHIRKWAAELTCSNKRIANLLSPLRTALQDAADDELISKNPLHNWNYQKNEPPKIKSDVDPFTEEEQKEIINTSNGCVKNQIIVFFWTGMRTSELVSLEWADIDWQRKKIRINKALTQASSKDEVPKTNSGNREIDMLLPVEQALKEQKQYTLLIGNKVFHNPRTNEPWTGDQPIRKAWIPILKKSQGALP